MFDFAAAELADAITPAARAIYNDNAFDQVRDANVHYLPSEH